MKCAYCDEPLENNDAAANHAGECVFMNMDKTDFVNMFKLLKTIVEKAERIPVPGGTSYTIDGALMGLVDVFLEQHKPSL